MFVHRKAGFRGEVGVWVSFLHRNAGFCGEVDGMRHSEKIGLYQFMQKNLDFLSDKAIFGIIKY